MARLEKNSNATGVRPVFGRRRFVFLVNWGECQSGEHEAQIMPIAAMLSNRTSGVKL